MGGQNPAMILPQVQGLSCQPPATATSHGHLLPLQDTMALPGLKSSLAVLALASLVIGSVSRGEPQVGQAPAVCSVSASRAQRQWAAAVKVWLPPGRGSFTKKGSWKTSYMKSLWYVCVHNEKHPTRRSPWGAGSWLCLLTWHSLPSLPVHVHGGGLTAMPPRLKSLA